MELVLSPDQVHRGTLFDQQNGLCTHLKFMEIRIQTEFNFLNKDLFSILIDIICFY